MDKQEKRELLQTVLFNVAMEFEDVPDGIERPRWFYRPFTREEILAQPDGPRITATIEAALHEVRGLVKNTVRSVFDEDEDEDED
jgi:hypothetical protein